VIGLDAALKNSDPPLDVIKLRGCHITTGSSNRCLTKPARESAGPLVSKLIAMLHDIARAGGGGITIEDFRRDRLGLTVRGLRRVARIALVELAVKQATFIKLERHDPDLTSAVAGAPQLHDLIVGKVYRDVDHADFASSARDVVNLGVAVAARTETFFGGRPGAVVDGHPEASEVGGRLEALGVDVAGKTDVGEDLEMGAGDDDVCERLVVAVGVARDDGVRFADREGARLGVPCQRVDDGPAAQLCLGAASDRAGEIGAKDHPDPL